MDFLSLARFLAGLRVNGQSSFGKVTEPTETIDVQGNIAVSGTVDGVDVSTVPSLLDEKVDKTTTVTAGDGLSGGGNLSDSITLENVDKGSDQNIFKNIEISGQNTIVSDNNDDTLTLSSNQNSSYQNLSLTTDDVSDSIDFSFSDSPEFSGVQLDLNGGTPGVGKLVWNDTDGTLSLGLKGGNVTAQLGQEIVYHVKNTTGSTIFNGTAVYAVGSQNNKLIVAPFPATGTISTEKFLGLATEDIPDESTGFVTHYGLVRGLNTSGIPVGSVVYADPDNTGGFTNLEPESPNVKVVIGLVATEDATNGAIQVRSHSSPIASDITYDNSLSTLIASNVQAAIDELDLSKAGVDTLSSNITLFPTTAPSDITNYNRLVTSTSDGDYNDTPVDVSTGVISVDDQLIAELAADPGLFVGNPGIINITTIGNIRKVSGNKNASFYFKVFFRDSSGIETLIAESEPTVVVTSSTYQQFSESALLNNGDFTSTDRIVIKYYGSPEGNGNNPEYEFQFGGNDPVRTLLPVPVNVIPSENAEKILTDTSSFDNILSATDENVQAALDTLDDHTHTTSEITEGSRLYFTEARVENVIDEYVDKDFIDPLGIDAVTLGGAGKDSAYHLDWANTTNKPSPTITLGGDLTGSVALTELASGTLNATIAENSVELGVDTTGDYVSSVLGTTNEVEVSVSGTEELTYTVGLPDEVSITTKLTSPEIDLQSDLNFISPDGLNTITASINDSDKLSFAGDFGEIFSATDTTSGTIFSINNDALQVDYDDTVRLTGNVLVGTTTDNNTDLLQVDGSAYFSGDVTATQFNGIIDGGTY